MSRRAPTAVPPARSLALAGSAAAVVAVPTLGPLLSRGEDVSGYDTAVTPPDYAFAVWGPIFAGIAVDALDGCRPRRWDASDHRVTAWPLATAYALNAAWSLAAQTGRFRWTPALLPSAVVATAVGFARLQREQGAESPTTVAAGALLGWTALAATVNVSAGTQLLGLPAGSPSAVAGSRLGVLATAGVLALRVAGARRGGWAAATTATWGLATTAGDRRRPAATRAVAAVGAATVALAGRRGLRGRAPA